MRLTNRNKNQLKGLTIGFIGVLVLADALHSGMEPYQLLINFAGMLIFVSAPYWWGRLDTSKE